MKKLLEGLNVIKTNVEIDTNRLLNGEEEYLEELTISYKGQKVRIPLDYANLNNSVQYFLEDIIDATEEYIA